MAIRVTPEAVAVIRRSLELAGADPSEVGVRLRRAGGQVRPKFAADPEPSDVVVEVDGLRIFVDANIAEGADLVAGDIEIAVTPEHETLEVRGA